MKWIFSIKKRLFVLMVSVAAVFSVSAVPVFANSLIGDFTISASPTTWTNQNVNLSVTSSGVNHIMLPDGTIVSGSTTTFSCTDDGAYTFIGYNSNNDVTAIESYVVSNIDRSGRSAIISPSDGSWRNTDVTVTIQGQ